MVTEVRKVNTEEPKAEPKVDPKVREAELKKLLGDEESGAYLEYQAGIQRKAKVAKAKELASAMVAEGGKYGVTYIKLDTQLEAIWQKCLQEARVKVGLPAVEPTK